MLVLLERGTCGCMVTSDYPGKERELMKGAEFDKETFGVMAKMLADDPDAPLMMRPQVEYREFVREHVALILPTADSDWREQERTLVDGVDQLTLLSQYSPDVSLFGHKTF
mgnify:FL=1